MKKGFTLIELLVVVAIIGLLSAIITANFAAARAKARDAQRVSDLSQIQLALAGYFNRCDSYPAAVAGVPDLNTPCPLAGISLSTFISKIPTPPTASETYTYTPYADPSNLDANNQPIKDDYVLKAILETGNGASNNTITQPPSWYGNHQPNTSADYYYVGSK